MDTYSLLKEELLKINQQASSLFADAQAIAGMMDRTFGDWEKTVSSINKQIAEELIRVAVVGPIKSGKSTFVNALLKGDYLKRGAGVVTSIVTRVRNGKRLDAKLLFKSWDEVNSDIQQALVMFPLLSQRSENELFDIRRNKERHDLQRAIFDLNSEQLISKGMLNPSSVLLSSYLKGYKRVKDIIASENITEHYRDGRFKDHRNFVGDEALAVYLKDIQLEINSGGIGENIEIADCQGSDSPNPLHLAMIQDYLMLTHFIIYVVSSRTGLREADIRFLSMIKKMGIMENILFVINCDFNEHESKDDFNTLSDKISDELALLKSDPDIYSFSALYNLFKVQRDNLPPKDGLRLAQWEQEEELAAFSDRETERFISSLQYKLTQERYALLLKNHIERLDVISTGINNWISINQNILSQDAEGVSEIIEKVKHHQASMNRLKSVIKSTLDGALQKIKQKLKTDIDRFFDARTGKVLKDIIAFIRDYSVDYHDYEESLKSSGFSNTLYLIFQEFKQALDTVMAENVNPEVIRFIREEEEWIRNQLDAVAGPYDLMIQDALAEYSNLMESFDVDWIQNKHKKIELANPESLKDRFGLSIPPAVASLRYTARIKTEAVIRFGFYTVVKVFRRLLKMPAEPKNREEIVALKNGVSRIKRETERSVIFLFKDYRENIKFQYIFKLAEAVSNNLYEVLMDRFRAYVTDLSNVVELIKSKKLDKQKTSELLTDMEMTAREFSQRIDAVRKKIEQCP